MTEAELQEIERKTAGHDAAVYVRMLIAEVRRLHSDPTEEMFSALAPLFVERERQLRADPAAGGCCCIGPHPVCQCIRHRITEEYRAMVAAS